MAYSKIVKNFISGYIQTLQTKKIAGTFNGKCIKYKSEYDEQLKIQEYAENIVSYLHVQGLIQKEKVHTDCEKSAQMSIFTKQDCDTMMTQYYH